MKQVKLKKQLGLFSGIGITMGVIIGSGIFITPVTMLSGTKSIGISLIMWSITGIISLFGGLCFAELGCLITESGGLYTYVHHGCGDMWAFSLLWCSSLVMYPASVATIAITCSRNFIQLAYMGCEAEQPDDSVILLSICVVSVIVGINVVSVKLATTFQNFMTFMKVFILCVIISIGIYNISIGKVENLQKPFENFYNNIGPGYVSALYSGIFAYSGWCTLNFITEEVIEPKKILIRSICISLPIIIFIYTMVNVSYFTELSYEEMLNSNAVAVSFGFKVHKTFAYIVPFFVGCSTFGSLNGGMLSIPRMYFVAARNNHLPEAFSFVNRTKTPAFAIIFCGMASIFYLFVLDTSSLILMATLVESSAILVCMVILINLRKKSKKKLNHDAVIYSFFVIQLIVTLIPIVYEPLLSLFGFIIFLTSFPVYTYVIKMKKNRINLETMNKTFQKLCMALPENRNFIYTYK